MATHTVTGRSIPELAQRTGREYLEEFQREPTTPKLLDLTATLFHVAAGLWVMAAAKKLNVPPEGAFGSMAAELAQQVWKDVAESLRPGTSKN